MKTVKILPIVVCSLFGTFASAAIASMQYEITPNIDFSRITGFMQTPKGGSPNTTSIGRPTFREINKTNNIKYDIELAAFEGKHRGYIGYVYNRLQNTVSLKQDLITHNQFIASGTNVRFKMGFDWSRVGYQHRYFENERSNLGLIGEAAYLKSRYQFQTPTIGSRRSFGGLNFRVGVNYYRHYDSGLASNFVFITSIPSITNSSILTTGFELTKHICDNHSGIAPLLGIGYNRINSKDGQRVPNHIRYESKPYVRLGLRVRY